MPSSFAIPRLPDDPTTDSIIAKRYPAKAHARRVASLLNSANGTIYLEAGPIWEHEDSDSEAPFRQRRAFYYLSGCPLSDSFLTYDIAKDHLTLYIPPIDPESVLWSGLPTSIDQAKDQFEVDEVLHTTASPRLSEGKVYIYAERQVSRPLGSSGGVDKDHLKPAIDEARVVKDEYEIALMTQAIRISSLAHNTILRESSKFQTERDAQAVFEAVCLANGAMGQAYLGIYAAGRTAATLHYTKNDASLSIARTPSGGTEKPQLLLCDAGAEFRSYGADITRVVPLGPGGTFTTEAEQIYSLVLDMQRKCIDAIRPGVHWESVHLLAHKILISGFLKLGIFRSTYSTESILEARTSCAFLPHGLGHWLGLDTHDTGGCPNYKDPDPMFKRLRVRRELVEGAVVTVEPGIYFCKFIIDRWLNGEEKGTSELHRAIVDEAVLERYWSVGGVRIEDDILVTKDGTKNLSADAVKELPEVYALAKGD